MIALAAATIEAPDALFVMNSPYALENEPTTYISYPIKEIISRKARSATFADIVKKVAENKTRLKQQGCDNLLAGMSSDGNSWIPEGKTHNGLPERDNHGTTWIYCNPHDRVMGSSPCAVLAGRGCRILKMAHHIPYLNRLEIRFMFVYLGAIHPAAVRRPHRPISVIWVMANPSGTAQQRCYRGQRGRIRTAGRH